MPEDEPEHIAMNRQWQFKHFPQPGEPLSGCFDYVESHKPQLADGQFLVKTRTFSIEPAMVPWMMSLADYMVPQEPGAPMLSWAMGEVVESRHSKYVIGERVTGVFGWQDYCVANGTDINNDIIEKVDPTVSDEDAVSVLWISGLTAMIGLYEIGKPVIGDTALISGAAGSVGHLVGQFAKLAGCRVVGIAGSEEKCHWLKDTLHFDDAINYKKQELTPAIQSACPGGVDLFWDNVGGQTLDAGIACLAANARVVMCGFLSIYSDFSQIPPMNNILAVAGSRANMSGFIVTDHKDKYSTAKQRIRQLLNAGRVLSAKTVLEGFDQLPQALDHLYAGRNTGKLIVKQID
ncbi:MAG: NADP-dependent oxidoreductase [Pseudomonadota bacterium]